MLILFYVKTSKPAKNGFFPIYLRITMNGARIETNQIRTINYLISF